MTFGKNNMANPEGRPKGSKNKMVLEMILDTADYLESKGKGLKAFALNDPLAFWTKIYTKIVPREISLPPDTAMAIMINAKEITKEDKPALLDSNKDNSDT